MPHTSSENPSHWADCPAARLNRARYKTWQPLLEPHIVFTDGGHGDLTLRRGHSLSFTEKRKSVCMLREFRFGEPVVSTNAVLGVFVHFCSLKGSGNYIESAGLCYPLDFHIREGNGAMSVYTAYLANHHFAHQPMDKHLKGHRVTSCHQHFDRITVSEIIL